MHHPTDRIAHTTAFVTPDVEHWLERKIAQWVHPMKDRSNDPSHHERTLLPTNLRCLLDITVLIQQAMGAGVLMAYCSSKSSADHMGMHMECFRTANQSWKNKAVILLPKYIIFCNLQHWWMTAQVLHDHGNQKQPISTENFSTFLWWKHRLIYLTLALDEVIIALTTDSITVITNDLHT